MLAFSFIFFGMMSFSSDSFFEQQLGYERVSKAWQNKKTKLELLCENAELSFPPEKIYIRAFKLEHKVEVWGAAKEGSYKLLKTYDLCKLSGDLGPKSKQGDLQVPEGFYNVRIFNPVSSFHLSFNVDYPNAYDKKYATSEDPGGDIYVHGGCETIGCLPMGDSEIEEIYLLAALAKDEGNDPKIHIFPAEMNEEKLIKLRKHFKQQDRVLLLWNNMKEVYHYFERTKKVPKIDIDDSNEYQINYK